MDKKTKHCSRERQQDDIDAGNTSDHQENPNGAPIHQPPTQGGGHVRLRLDREPTIRNTDDDANHGHEHEEQLTAPRPTNGTTDETDTNQDNEPNHDNPETDMRVPGTNGRRQTRNPMDKQRTGHQKHSGPLPNQSTVTSTPTQTKNKTNDSNESI